MTTRGPARLLRVVLMLAVVAVLGSITAAPRPAGAATDIAQAATPPPPGGVFLTSHTFDSLASFPTRPQHLDQDPQAARRVIRAAVDYATRNTGNVRLLYVSSGDPDPGSVAERQCTGMRCSGYTQSCGGVGRPSPIPPPSAFTPPTGPLGCYDAAGIDPPNSIFSLPILDLRTVNFALYDAVVVASVGVASDAEEGIKREELDALIARKDGLRTFVSCGGGLVAFGENAVSLAQDGGDVDAYRSRLYAFWSGFGVRDNHFGHVVENSTEGQAARDMGLTGADFENSLAASPFKDPGGFSLVNVDDDQEQMILSLAQRPGTPTTSACPCAPVGGPSASGAAGPAGPTSAGMVGPGLVDAGLAVSAWATALTQRRRRRTADGLLAEPTRPARRAGERGFTLVELLVVVAILGILSAVVLFAVRGADDKGAQAAVDTDERIVRTALEVYCAQKGQYPAEERDPVTGAVVKDPMQVLVDAKFLGTRSTHFTLTTGDGTGTFDPPGIDPMGNCPGTGPNNYKLEPTDPGRNPNCP